MSRPTVDSRTLRYLELVSGKRGDKAVDAWLAYTGWRYQEKGRAKQTTLAARLHRAKENADLFFVDVERLKAG